ncbi:MAG: ATP-grasp domain-containing protein [Ruminococcaceae bacterium]|nr:ATP-grasp domain-containing protein [Oscillospiraceae bacterium]
MCSVGRRGELIKDFKKTLSAESKIVATDNSKYAPALYLADKQYIVPRIDSENYIDIILDICKKENISAVTTFIDPEIEVLANNREKFEKIGVELLVPYLETAKLCFDKYKMFKFLKQNNISTVMTWGTIEEFDASLKCGEVSLPVFVKPRTGSGSVGARKVDSYEQLVIAMKEDPSLIIQELMQCKDMDADVYIDTITHQAVSAFSKKKIETRIGGASKTISFKDERLFDFIQRIVSVFEFNGPVDMDFFYRDGEYYLSEINPRFGGAYLHAYGAGVDFIKLIENNLKGNANEVVFGNYDEGVVMMMYDSVVICNQEELAEE